MKSNKQNILAGDLVGLDLGTSRTGVARLHTVARIAEPLPIIDMNNADLVDEVGLLVAEHGAKAVIVGLPRGLGGQDTDQTMWAREQIELLEESLTVPVFATDEAGTTIQAEKRAKPDESVDSVAAGIILEDFAQQVAQGKIDNVSF